MIYTISETPAMVTDTVAGVNILNLDIKEANDSAKDSLILSDTAICDSLVKDSTTGYQPYDSTKTYSDSLKAVIQANTKEIESEGVLGIPKSESMTHSDIVTSAIFACFLLTMAILSVSRHQFSQQTRSFFNRISKSNRYSAETINITKRNIYFVFQTCIEFSVITYIAADSLAFKGTIKASPIMIIGIGTIFYMLYFLIKYLLYKLTNYVFFEDQRIMRQHSVAFCYIISIQGLLILPLLLSATSADISIQTFAIYTVSVIILAKLLAFYKTICTFSGHHTSFLQIILYFCALEIIPLMSLYGVLVMIARYL